MDERHEAFELSVFISVLVLSYLLISPFMHEMTHITFLKSLGCFYRTEWAFNLVQGLSASVQPYCGLSSLETLFFYLSGYLSPLLVGSVLSVHSLEFEDLDTVRGVFTGSLGAGLLLSTAITMTVKGDIANSLLMAGFNPVYGHFASFFVFLGASSTSFLVLVHVFDRSEWEE